MKTSERNDIMLKNQGLVYKIARQYVKNTNSLELEDLISEGQFGLSRALESFDESKGFEFSTYATYWIKYYITKSIVNTDRLVRLPMHVHRNKETKINKKKEYNEDIEEFNFADSNTFDTPEENLTIFKTKNFVEAKLNLLKTRLRTIIILRYGLLNHEVHTIRQISEKINLSVERTRQLHIEALKELKGTLNELNG